MELVIQKAVELGAYEIIPVATRRAVVKLDAKKEQNKQKRWNAISESAAKQSKRNVIPRVTGVMRFEEAVAYASGMDVKLIPTSCRRAWRRQGSFSSPLFRASQWQSLLGRRGLCGGRDRPGQGERDRACLTGQTHSAHGDGWPGGTVSFDV